MCYYYACLAAVGHTRLSRKVMSLRRAKSSVTGEEVERRAGLKSALPVRKDIVAVREKGHDCSVELKGLRRMTPSGGINARGDDGIDALQVQVQVGGIDALEGAMQCPRTRVFPGSHL